MTVSVIVPAVTPLTRPDDTVATAVLDDDQVASDVTFSEIAVFARTTNAAYCDEVPTPGAVPATERSEIAADGNVVLLLHAPVKKIAARMKDNFTNRVDMIGASCTSTNAANLRARKRRYFRCRCTD